MKEIEKQEINEYLAEHLFGLEICRRTTECLISRKTCVKENVICEPDDYITDWQQVVDKLHDKACCMSIRFMGKPEVGIVDFTYPDGYNPQEETVAKARGETIGEAVCRIPDKNMPDNGRKAWDEAKKDFCDYIVMCAFQGKLHCENSYGEITPVKAVAE